MEYESVPARTITRGNASGTLRTWAQGLLAEDWSEETVLDAIVVLEELASHVCSGGAPAQVRLSYQGGNRLRIELDDERAVPIPLGSDIGGMLIRHVSRASGMIRRPWGATFWAEVGLVARHIPSALPGGPALAPGPFEPGHQTDN